MCHYTLDVCPYPHTDPIASTVLDPEKYKGWKLCDRPRPWGRLSCGNLSIHHHLSEKQRHSPSQIELPLHTRSSTEDTNGTGSSSNSDAFVLTLTPDTNPNSDVSIDRGNDGLGSTEYDTLPSIDHFPNTCNKCEWCTVTLTILSYKSKEVQEQGRSQRENLEVKIGKSQDLKRLYEGIAKKEAEVDDLRHLAWLMAMEVLRKAET